MHPEVAAVVAEINLRNQHKPRSWSKRDQADEDAWTKHDRENHAMPYAICTVCEYQGSN